jgi:small conductance mechanosensitive channel
MILFDGEATRQSFSQMFIDNLESWSSKGWVSFLGTLLGGLVWVLVMRLLIKWFLSVLRKVFAKGKGVNHLMANFICQIINILAWILIIVWFLNHMGINMGPVLAGLGITGVVLGLAFQETLGNLLSGVMIIINAPFKIGDYIDSGSFSGTVSDMDLICVTLVTPDNRRITMSNKLVWGSPIVNYSAMDKRRVDMTVSVAYGSDISKVKTLLLQRLASYPEVLPSPAPTIEVGDLGENAVDFIVRPWTKPEDVWPIRWRFQSEWYDLLTNAGIDVPFDQLDVHVKYDND